jgi:hypothetical protein
MSLNLRAATQADLEQIEVLVSAAYEKYIPLIGRKPKPMLANYRLAIARYQFWEYEQESKLAAVVELIPSGISGAA